MTDERIGLDHGSGGRVSHKLVADILVPAFDNPVLSRMDDGAVIDMPGNRLAFSTDSYVVDPIFFPGGNIGDLAINGTVNDLAMCGAEPLYLSVGLIIEEGFPVADLKTVLESMRSAAEKAGVRVVTGDTKVVPKGAADKIFINTSGVGVIRDGTDVSGNNVRPGDKIILSGSVADHGMTVLARREGMAFETSIKSDTAPLNEMVGKMLEAGEVHAFRDPTRGGLGTSLNEIAIQSGVGLMIHEDKIPVKKEIAGICELLGFDPLYVANEGKLIAFVAPDDAGRVLAAARENEFGTEACFIGEAVAENPGKVFMKTGIGGTRIVDMLAGEQLPRIC